MKKLQYLFMSLAAMLIATPAFAQAGASAKRSMVPASERSVHAWFCQARG